MIQKENKLKKEKGLTKIDCEITGADIERMIDYYDSGMCDVTTQNAASLALKRIITPNHVVRISRRNQNAPYVCEVGGTLVELSCDLIELFEQICYGIAPLGYHFQAAVPSDLVPEPEQNEGTVQQTLHSKKMPKIHS